jgi:hypothetical protein
MDVIEPSSFEVEIPAEKLERYKSTGIPSNSGRTDEVEGNTLCSKIHILGNSIWNKEELPQQWKESITVPIYKKVIKLTAIITGEYQCYKLHTKLYPIFFPQG